MDLREFLALPDEAQLWIYGFKSPLDPVQKRTISDRLQGFLGSWSSHGRSVQGAFAFSEDQFVLLAGWLADGISGCSVDESVRQFRALQAEENIDGMDRSLIYFRGSDSKIRAVPFTTFQAILDSGEATLDTFVLDTTIQSLRELRKGTFEVPLRNCWHARRFRIPEAAR